MLSVFDLACDDAITNRNTEWLKTLSDIWEGKYDIIDNEIKTIVEVCLLIKNNKNVYCYNVPKDEIQMLDPIFLDLIEQEKAYEFAVKRNIDNGILKFLRTEQI